MDRREFVRVSALAGGGMLLAVAFPRALRADGDQEGGPADFSPNAWISVDETGAVTILSHKSEMGQGVWTALPMIVAEEMDADWKRVRVERAPTRPQFDTATGGSGSVRDSWDPLRRAGAVARALLVSAAAKRWSVPAERSRWRRPAESPSTASGRSRRPASTAYRSAR